MYDRRVGPTACTFILGSLFTLLLPEHPIEVFGVTVAIAYTVLAMLWSPLKFQEGARGGACPCR